MKYKTLIEQRIRGWLPKENALPSNQIINMFNHPTRFQFIHLAYSIMLGTLLVMPIGVYHSISEPYITGYLWGTICRSVTLGFCWA
jgi:hypothetical protein